MFVLSHNPHRRRPEGAVREPLSAALALGPLALAAAWLWPARFPAAFGASLAAGLGVALAMGRGRVSKPAAGWCAYEALLMALLMPAGAAWQVPALMTAGVVFARTLVTDRDFLPPVNVLALALGTALLFNEPAAFELSFGPPDAAWGAGRGSFFFLSGWAPLLASLLLSPALRARAFKWRMPAWFLFSAVLSGGVWGRLSGIAAPPGWALVPLYAAGFAAVTLVADPRPTPLSARGQTGAGSVAGIVFALFALRGMPYQGMVFAALAANLMAPMLDYLLARVPAR